MVGERFRRRFIVWKQHGFIGKPDAGFLILDKYINSSMTSIEYLASIIYPPPLNLRSVQSAKFV